MREPGGEADDLRAVRFRLRRTAQGPSSAASPGEKRALQRIADQLLAGHGQLLAGRYLDACDSFRQATARALDLSR